MHYEFDQLLEDLWDGRLDEAGRRRLDELCAADPRLAARYRQERNLTGLLTRCGPNHAPDDLARSVMARLETRVRIRPVRPWYWWMMEPAFRTAFAAVVLVALGVQIGVLIASKKGSRELASAPLPSKLMNVQITQRPQAPEVPDPGEPHPAPAQSENRVTKPGPVKRLQPAESTKKKLQYTEPMVAMNVPTPKPTPEPVVEPFPTPSPAGNAAGQPAAFPAIIQPASPVVPTAVPTATPKPAIPEVQIPAETRVAQAKAAPLSLAEREVAMQITLNPNALPLPSADANRPASPLPPSAETFVPQSQAKPRQVSLTHKDVETALFAVPGVTEKDVTYGPVPGAPNKWQVRAKLTPVQFRSFIGLLRKTGIGPSPAVTAGSEAEAESLRSQPPSRTRNLFDLTQGRQWVQPSAKPRVSMVPATQSAGTTSTVKERSESAADEKLDVKIIIDQVDGLLSTH